MCLAQVWLTAADPFCSLAPQWQGAHAGPPVQAAVSVVVGAELRDHSSLTGEEHCSVAELTDLQPLFCMPSSHCSCPWHCLRVSFMCVQAWMLLLLSAAVTWAAGCWPPSQFSLKFLWHGNPAVHCAGVLWLQILLAPELHSLADLGAHIINTSATPVSLEKKKKHIYWK